MRLQPICFHHPFFFLYVYCRSGLKLLLPFHRATLRSSPVSSDIEQPLGSVLSLLFCPLVLTAYSMDVQFIVFSALFYACRYCTVHHYTIPVPTSLSCLTAYELRAFLHTNRTVLSLTYTDKHALLLKRSSSLIR